MLLSLVYPVSNDKSLFRKHIPFPKPIVIVHVSSSLDTSSSNLSFWLVLFLTWTFWFPGHTFSASQIMIEVLKNERKEWYYSTVGNNINYINLIYCRTLVKKLKTRVLKEEPNYKKTNILKLICRPKLTFPGALSWTLNPSFSYRLLFFFSGSLFPLLVQVNFCRFLLFLSLH